MRIYVASSWRNLYQPTVVTALRQEGYEVYDFRHPAPDDDGFHWAEIDPAWQAWTPGQYQAALQHPLAQVGFAQDKLALQMNWLRVLGTAELPHMDQSVCHQLHAKMSLLQVFKPQEQPLEFILPRKGPINARPQRMDGGIE